MTPGYQLSGNTLSRSLFNQPRWRLLVVPLLAMFFMIPGTLSAQAQDSVDLSSQVRLAPSSSPSLTISSGITNVTDGDNLFSISVVFDNGGNNVTSIGFELEYAPTCLHIDPTDADGDGVPNAVTDLPGAVNVATVDNVNGTVGIAVINIFAPPVANGTIATIAFTVQPACQQDGSYGITFDDSQDSFGDPGGADIPGIVPTTTISIPVSYNQAPSDIILVGGVITEGLSSLQTVGTFTTTDLDTDDLTHTYQLTMTGLYTDNSLFTILTDTLQTTYTFDFEDRNVYTIHVKSTDPHGSSYSETMTVTVADANEAPTDISLSNATITENLPISSVIGTLTAMDPDAGATHTFSLVDSSTFPANSSFVIMTDTLKSNGLLNHEPTGLYNINVRADDGAGGYFTETFTITVTDANDAPTALSLTNTVVAEGSITPTIVGNFVTVDEDVSDTHTYTFVNSGVYTNNSLFTIMTNTLKANVVFDAGAQSVYTVSVRTEDSHGGQFTDTLTITISSGNDLPTDIGLSNATIAENQPVGTMIGTLNTADLDVSDTHTYTLLSGSAFTITGDALKSTTIFDYETQNAYTISVRTDDGHGGVYTGTLAISVTNVNEAPTDMGLSRYRISESAAIGTPVGVFTTTDVDTGTFAITNYLYSGIFIESGAFSISGDQLNTNTALNYATDNEYLVHVKTDDTHGGIYSETFTILVMGTPSLSIDSAPVSTTYILQNQPLTVSLSLVAKNQPITKANLSIDLHNSCMTFDISDSNGDSIPDAFTMPAGFTGTVTHNSGDNTGELDINIMAMGNQMLSEGIFSTIQLSTTSCLTTTDFITTAQIAFSTTQTPTLTNMYSESVSTSGNTGQEITILQNHSRGDCNGDGSVNASDFTSVILEAFDTSNDTTSWLSAPTGNFKGSPIGCDANNDQNIQISDVTCTVLVYFGDTSCTAPATPSTARTATASLAIAGELSGNPGTTVDVPVALQSNGNEVASVGMRINFDPAMLSIDGTDANGDGVPDAVRLNVPDDYQKIITVDNENHAVNIALFDASLPLSSLADGDVATVQFQVNASANSGVTMVDIVDGSLGSPLGQNVDTVTTGGEVSITGTPVQQGFNLFLPEIRR